MLKSIKKSIKYLLILAGIILLVPTFFYLLVRIPEVQTFVVQRITSHFSDQIKTTITVSRFEYTFFNKLLIKDLLIKDKNNDTLIYSKKVTAGFRKLDFRNRVIKLGHVELTEPSVGLITDTTGLMNLNWYLSLFGTKSDTTGKQGTNISVNQITIKDGRFLLLNKMTAGSRNPIDFNNLRVSGISGHFENLRIKDDSVKFGVNDFLFRESGGFTVKEFSGKIIVAPDSYLFENIFMNCDSSIVNADHVIISADSSGSFKRFNDEVRLDILLRKSLLSFKDLQYFLPVLKGSDETIEASGKISGTISELKGRDIKLSLKNRTSLDCDFDVSGLPDLNSSFIYIGVNSLKTNANDLEKMKFPGKEKLEIPETIYRLGNISFNGNFTGFTTDFVAYGKLSTDLGIIKTDISLRPEKNKMFKVKGMIAGINIDLGKLTTRSDIFGKVSMKTDLDGYATSIDKIQGNLTGNIDSIDIKNYVYRNIALNGVFTDKTWDGSIKMLDRNVKLDMLGMFDFRNELPEFDFTLNLDKANLYRLNLDKSDTSSQLSMLITANFKGNSIDNLFGEIKLLNSTYIKHDGKLELYNFSLKAFSENNRPAISLRTDFLDADLRGYYNFSTFGTVLKSVLATLAPSKYAASKPEKLQVRNNFRLTCNFKNTDKLTGFFNTGIQISPNSTLDGKFYPDSLISIDMKSDRLNIRNNIFSNLALNARFSGQELHADLRSNGLSLLGQSDLKNFHAELNSKSDNLGFLLNWDGKERTINRGSFFASGQFLKKPGKNEGTILKIEIDSSDVYTRSNLWKINRSTVVIDSDAVKIDRFVVHNGENSYVIDGKVSEDPSDTLKFIFKGIDISPLGNQDNTQKKADDNTVPYNPKGIIKGNILISNLLKSPLMESNIFVKNFSLLGSEYGDLRVISAWNAVRKVADISANSTLRGLRNLDVTGSYDPQTRKINLDAKASKLPVDALNPLLKFFASGISGNVSGRVNLSGELDKLVMKGAVMAENTSLKIDYLQAKYLLNDSIRFDASGIRFKNVRITDEKKNAGTITGYVYHTSFRDYTVDLTINMNGSPCLVLNTQPKDNPLFYGTAYATGVTTIRSGPGTLNFDISARAGKGTKFYIPLNSGLSVTEHPFVSFVSHDTIKKDKPKKVTDVPVQSSGTKIVINMDLDIIPDAEVQLLIDPKAGDVIKGRGEGKLNISLNKKGDFNIYGDYTIEDGEYLFTLQNIMNKRFDVENGGKISFNGSVYNAEIDLKAIYKNLKTSLFPILQDERYNERIPVEPQLNLSGKLFNPVVGFNIYLPTADEETRSYLQNAITTEEELSRQFLYLLVMNSFYADPNFNKTTSINTSTGTSAMAVTTTEMLSNQLSNWLSQISKDFDVNFVYRPGNKDINSQDVQVALSTQLLNDKMTINGNFDVRGASTSDAYGYPITGDFDIEYKITEKIRFKVFNRYNNPYTGRGVPYTQGLGVFYKQDFNTFSDLLRKKEPSPMKKEEEIKVK